ncbi:MAG: lptC, partial [Sediminibacterium sp.]|nr:lptC [Sediminibacterium sp.]
MINRNFHKTLFTAAVLAGCFFMSACENDVNIVRELGKRKTSVEEGRDIQTYLSMNGRMKAKLTAPLLLRYQGDSAKKAEFPNSLHVDFYNDSMKIESQLNARYGRYLENENKVFLRDHVVAFNIKGDTLFCKEMYWDQNLGQFYTDKEVTISQRSPQKRFNGIGMKCNQDLTDLTLYKIQPGSFAVVP